jgi:hypothetical protein
MASPPEWLVTLIGVSDYVVVALGLTIAAIAFRGYRRNDSRPMLFVSMGFVLVLGVPFAMQILALVGPLPEFVAAALSQAAELAGMASILYGLWL